MSAGEAYEPHSVDDAYEGVQWLGGEAFYTKKKEKRKSTREDAIYGVFAEGGDFESAIPSAKRPHRRRMDASQPVTADEPIQRSNGIEISLPKPKPVPEEVSPKQPEEEETTLPTSFGQKIREGAIRRQKEEQEREDLKHAWKEAGSSGFASFEQHSRGIASKLMQKMGYKPGEGLGARKQGVVDPIVQKMRPKGMGMGYGDFKEQTVGPLPQEEAEIEVKETRAKPKEQPRLWKTSAAKDRKKRQLKTATEVLQESEESWKAPILSTVLDMRGPKARVLTDLTKIGEDVPDDSRPMPELQHNLNLLVEITETEIKNLNAKLKATEDIAELMNREEDRLETERQERQDKLEKMKSVKDRLDDVISRLDPFTQLDTLLEGCSALKQETPSEFETCKVPFIILDKVVPYFEHLYQNWHPFLEMERGLEEIQRWSLVLSEHLRFGDAALEENPLALLLTYVMLPPLRSVIVNQWSPRQPGDLLEFLDIWRSVIPDRLMKYICTSLVFPKLKAQLEEWDPCKDSIPVHVWIHPWLLWMNQKLNQLYPTIVSKLINALQVWHPSDRSALVLLSPWKTVFSQKQWEELLAKAILPKLAQSIQEYEVDPLTHNLSVVCDLLAWTEVIPKQHVVHILETILFPKWLKVLHHWLTHEPKLSEVSNWYLSWKSIFPDAVANDVAVDSSFARALELMNCAAEGRMIPSVESFSDDRYGATNRTVPVVKAMPKMIFTLRDMVEKFAEDHNVSFVPKPGRMHEGFQVYGFGRVSVVLDNSQNMVRAQFGQSWRPISLEQLIVEMQNRQ